MKRCETPGCENKATAWVTIYGERFAICDDCLEWLAFEPIDFDVERREYVQAECAR